MKTSITIARTMIEHFEQFEESIFTTISRISCRIFHYTAAETPPEGGFYYSYVRIRVKEGNRGQEKKKKEDCGGHVFKGIYFNEINI